VAVPVSGVEAGLPDASIIMNIRSLLYHDVVPPGEYARSGFVSPDANLYKLPVDLFTAHLEAIAARGNGNGTGISLWQAMEQGSGCLLTFDDGGSSAITHISGLLHRFGFTGHFFITTDYIDKPGFLTRSQIVELASQGHVIGSHSCSHPLLMSHCPTAQLEREWKQSVEVLSGILGQPVTTASIPGGSYSRQVAETAAEAGIRLLFTSEPTSSVESIGPCRLLGRYSVQQGTLAEEAAALGSGDLGPCLRQFLWWNLKKVVKRTGGVRWLRFRKAVLARRKQR
jgi:peptidoglycan/xylan/chitin deacetylase (PgdA/CDA1 family)